MLFKNKNTTSQLSEENYRQTVKLFGEEAIAAYAKHGYEVGLKYLDFSGYGGKTIYIKPLKGKGDTIEIPDCCGGEDFTRKLFKHCGQKLELDNELKGKLKDWYSNLYNALDSEILDVPHAPDFLNHVVYKAENVFKDYYGEDLFKIFKDNNVEFREVTYNANYMKTKIVCFPDKPLSVKDDDDYCYFNLTMVDQGKEDRNKISNICESLNRAVVLLSASGIRTAKNLGNEEDFFPAAHKMLCNLRDDVTDYLNKSLEQPAHKDKHSVDIDR